jgi:hypothetical protein
MTQKEKTTALDLYSSSTNAETSCVGARGGLVCSRGLKDEEGTGVGGEGTGINSERKRVSAFAGRGKEIEARFLGRRRLPRND